MTLRTEALECLAHNEVALKEGYRCGRILEDKGWMQWPAASWDEPAVVAFEGDKCVAGLNYSYNEKTRVVTVDFAWCSPEYPKALMLCLLGFRKALRAKPTNRVAFSHHVGNEAMAKLVRKLRIPPKMIRYEVPINALASGASLFSQDKVRTAQPLVAHAARDHTAEVNVGVLPSVAR